MVEVVALLHQPTARLVLLHLGQMQQSEFTEANRNYPVEVQLFLLEEIKPELFKKQFGFGGALGVKRMVRPGAARLLKLRGVHTVTLHKIRDVLSHSPLPPSGHRWLPTTRSHHNRR